MSTMLYRTDLRSGAPKDLNSVAQIMQEAFDARYGEGWTTAQCMGILSLPGAWLTVASIDGQDAGFALSRAILDDAELLLLATRPSARRRGVAGALLRSVIAECGTRNCTRLHLEVRAGNEAIELYRREGFEKIGERPRYYRGKSGQLFDALTFARPIG